MEEQVSGPGDDRRERELLDIGEYAILRTTWTRRFKGSLSTLR
jgi:hypothetical protein